MRGLAPALDLTQTPTGEQVLQNRERVKRPIFDTFRLTAGVVIPDPIDFFVFPLGQIGSGFAVAKDYQNCNFTKSQQLSKHEAINIEGIEVTVYQVGAGAFSDANARLVAAILEDSHFELKVQDDVVLQGRLKNFTSGSGITGIPFMNAVAPQTTITTQPTLRGVRRLARKIMLPSGVKFQPRIFPNQNNTLLTTALAAGSELLFRLSLYGMASRTLD